MKICLVSHEYPPDTARGGIGTLTWNTARALANLGHTVHVVSCAARPGPDPQTASEGGVTVHRIQPPGFEFPVNSQAAYSTGYAWSVFRHLRRLSDSLDFDVINFPEYGGEGFVYQLDRTPWDWVPVVVHLHGPLAMFAERIGWPEKDTEFYRVGTLMEQASITAADGLMASSANIADFASEFYGVDRESIDVVHCGVDPEVFRPADGGQRADGRPTVLFVGNLAANKGLTTVFEAVLRLQARYPEILLQVLGRGDDDLQQTLQRRAAREGAAANVQFIGFVEDRARLPEFYRRADAFCSPAHHEVGVANVYVEAMACGCPVVACLTGGAPEAVVDGQTGLLVPPADVEATTAALDRLLGDAALRRRMGQAGRRRVEEYFAIDRYISRVLTAYERTIERSRAKLSRLRSAGNPASASR